MERGMQGLILFQPAVHGHCNSGEQVPMLLVLLFDPLLLTRIHEDASPFCVGT